MKFDPEKLHQARRSARLSQEELAEAAGCHGGTISRIELGKMQPRERLAQAIAAALQTDVNALSVDATARQDKAQEEHLLRLFRELSDWYRLKLVNYAEAFASLPPESAPRNIIAEAGRQAAARHGGNAVATGARRQRIVHGVGPAM